MRVDLKKNITFFKNQKLEVKKERLINLKFADFISTNITMFEVLERKS
jgi:hypothetical protein